MKKIKTAFFIFIVLAFTLLLTGCWNYREVDKLTIVAGIAIDKGVENKYQMTTEIIQITTGKDIKTTPKTISSEGETLFDAARNIISITGKRLYWSHTKVIILSKEIASEGVSKVLDWYNRDAETREDVHILISEGESAKEIFKEEVATENIVSFSLDEILDNQVSLSKAPVTDIMIFDIESQTKGISPVIPSINLKQIDEKNIPQIMGTAIIKDDKLVGFLDGEETKDLIFIRNEIKGGILVEEMQINNQPTLISLEIFENKTKITPTVNGEEIIVNIDIETKVAIGEVIGKGYFFDEKGLKKLEKSINNTFKKRIESLIKKIQLEYDADIFGFASKLWEDKSKVFKSVSGNWNQVFKDLKVNVKTKIVVKNSAIIDNGFKEGE